MTINWYGEGCFKLQEGGLTALLDPFEKSTGLTPPRNKADVVIKSLMPSITLDQEKPVGEFDENAQVIVGPGEYEIKGIRISGWPLVKDSSDNILKSIYRIKFGDLVIATLGHISEFNDPEVVEELGEVHILIIPGGNKPFLNQAVATKLIRQIQPKIVIPAFIKVKGLKRPAGDVKDFLKELGQEIEIVEKLSIKKKTLPEKLKVIGFKI